MTPTKPEDALVELQTRLRATWGSCVLPDGTLVVPSFVNPDGPEAADAITTLLERERILTIIPVCGDPVLYVDGKRICKVSGATDEGRLLMSLEGLIK